MKTAFTISLLLFSSTFAIAQPNKIAHSKLVIDFPNDEWSFKGEQTSGNTTIQFFKRTPIVDSLQRSVIANISILTETDVSQDVVTYSAIKRVETPFDVENVFIPKDIKMKYKNGIGYKGTYSDKYGLHRIYFIFFEE
ncbi:MAG: hypothetical protein KDC79_13840 [Cyclobacteriaceae bacterium]|nr:hypothetical protein [Cyclobacteriaceae bacterium]